jgi:type III pantothenate kinase
VVFEEGGVLEESSTAVTSEAVVWGRTVEDLLQQPVDACVLGSVHQEGGVLQEQLRAAGCRKVVAYHRGDQFPLRTNLREPQTVGVDRLAAARGAWQPQQGAIVVDLGTAITVDWIDAERVFQGGAIVPGLTLSSQALAAGCARLPEVSTDAEEPLHLPGRSTHEAIQHGLDVGIPSLVDHLVQDLRITAGAGTPLWVTGGDAPWYLRRTRLPFRHETHLVARGLLAALLDGEGEG